MKYNSTVLITTEYDSYLSYLRCSVVKCLKGSRVLKVRQEPETVSLERPAVQLGTFHISHIHTSIHPYGASSKAQCALSSFCSSSVLFKIDYRLQILVQCRLIFALARLCQGQELHDLHSMTITSYLNCVVRSVLRL